MPGRPRPRRRRPSRPTLDLRQTQLYSHALLRLGFRLVRCASCSGCLSRWAARWALTLRAHPPSPTPARGSPSSPGRRLRRPTRPASAAPRRRSSTWGRSAGTRPCASGARCSRPPAESARCVVPAAGCCCAWFWTGGLTAAPPWTVLAGVRRALCRAQEGVREACTRPSLVDDVVRSHMRTPGRGPSARSLKVCLSVRLARPGSERSLTDPRRPSAPLCCPMGPDLSAGRPRQAPRPRRSSGGGRCRP